MTALPKRPFKRSILLNFKKRFTRIDPDTALEKIAYWGSYIFIVLALSLKIILNTTFSTEASFLLASVALFLSAVRAITDCTYVLDNEERVLYYSFAILGQGSTYKVCNFSEVKKIGIQVQQTIRQRYLKFLSQYNQVYTVVMEIDGGICFSVSQEDVVRQNATRVGAAMAEHLGCEFLDPRVEVSTLDSNYGEVPKTEVDLKWASWNELSNPGGKELALFFMATLTFFMLFF